MKNQNNKIMISFNKENTVFGISIPCEYENEKIMDDIEKINFPYIKYNGIKYFEENGERLKKHFIKFVDMPINLIKEFANIIQKSIDEINKQETIYESFINIINLFSKYKLSKQKKQEFNNDFGIALFIFYYKNKYNIDLSKYLKDEDGLNIFVIPEFNRNIKLLINCKNKETITFDWKNNDFFNKEIYMIKFQYENKKTNILELYKKIGFLSNVIKEKYEYWNFMVNDEKFLFILEDTVDLNNILCLKLKKDIFPNVSINNDNYINSIKITLNIDSSCEDDNETIEKLLP